LYRTFDAAQRGGVVNRTTATAFGGKARNAGISGFRAPSGSLPIFRLDMPPGHGVFSVDVHVVLAIPKNDI
jgi:hypothetical protein